MQPLAVARVRLRRAGAAGLAAAAFCLLLPEPHETLHALALPAPSFEPSVGGAGHPAQPAHVESAEERSPGPCIGCLIQLRSAGRLTAAPLAAARLTGSTSFDRPARARPTLEARCLASPRAPPSAA